MSVKDDFAFLNSPVWIKYSQESYKTPEEIKYRLDKVGHSVKNWSTIKSEIIRFRKTGAIPLFLPSIETNFWFYPSDSIIRKAHEIEKLGLALYEKINSESNFASEFKLDSTIEEAITSAIYEGANSTRAKAQELIETNAVPKNKDEWMLVNNYRALMWIKENHNTPLTLSLINQIHDIVTKNTLEARADKSPKGTCSNLSPAGPRGFWMSSTPQPLCYKTIAAPLILFTGKIKAIFSTF